MLHNIDKHESPIFYVYLKIITYGPLELVWALRKCMTRDIYLTQAAFKMSAISFFVDQ